MSQSKIIIINQLWRFLKLCPAERDLLVGTGREAREDGEVSARGDERLGTGEVHGQDVERGDAARIQHARATGGRALRGYAARRERDGRYLHARDERAAAGARGAGD